MLSGGSGAISCRICRSRIVSPRGTLFFLYFEREGQPVNVASVAVFEGAIPLELCTEHIESKLPLIPRYRQRVTFPPFHMDLPMWEYDPKFNIATMFANLRSNAGPIEFKTVVSKILSTALNRDRPLWELILMRGLKENRTGAILRMHHCLADGISGVGVLNVLFDSSPFFTPPPKGRQPCPPLPAGLGTASRDGLITSSISAIQRVLTASSELLEVAKQWLLPSRILPQRKRRQTRQELKRKAACRCWKR